MSKAAYILFGIATVAILTVAYLFYTFLTPASQQPTDSTGYAYPADRSGVAPGGTATTTGGTTIVGPTITLSTANNKTIEIHDFRQDPTVYKDPINKGYYHLGYDPSTVNDPPYLIEYIETTKFFVIALLQEPIAANRILVESYLMKTLGIGRDEMCALNYSVSTPTSVNQTYGGVNLGFSFCPGAVVLQ